MIEIHTERGLSGTIELDEDGHLTGSTNGLQRMADNAVTNAGGNAQAAYDLLSTMNNGYTWAIQT